MMGRPLSEMRPVPRRGPARVDLNRVVFAKSQQFDRPLMTLWIDVAPIPQGGPTARQHHGRIKAAKCRPVGWLKKSRVPGPCKEVHFSPQPAFSDSARKINARCTSRAATWSASAVTAHPSAAQRAFRPFGSTLVSWHIAAKACPHKTRRLAGLLRSSPDGPAGGPERER
jgi:hypothetical protein